MKRDSEHHKFKTMGIERSSSLFVELRKGEKAKSTKFVDLKKLFFFY